MLRIGMSSDSTSPAASTSASIVTRGRTLPPRAAASTAVVSSFRGPPVGTTAAAPAIRAASAKRSSVTAVWITTARLGLRSSTSSVRRMACSGRSSSMTITRWTSSTGSIRQGSLANAEAAMGGNSHKRLGRLRIYQATPDRVAGQVDPVAQPELLEDVRAVALDRLLAQHQQRRDLLRRVALGDQLRHLFLARRQRVLARRSAVARVGQEVLDERRHRARVEERLAAHCGAAGLDEVLVRCRLEDVTRGACLQRLVQVLLVVVHREDEHLRVGVA